MEIYLADKMIIPLSNILYIIPSKQFIPITTLKGLSSIFLRFIMAMPSRQALAQGEVYLLKFQKQWVATASINGNAISRLFVLPQFQGNGCGTRLMDEMESFIFSEYDMITLSSSWPAYQMYLNRGIPPFPITRS